MLDMSGAGRTLLKFDACHAEILKITKKGLRCCLLTGPSKGITKFFQRENGTLLEGSSFRKAKAAGRQLAAARERAAARPEQDAEAEEEDMLKPSPKVLDKVEAEAFAKNMFAEDDDDAPLAG